MSHSKLPWKRKGLAFFRQDPVKHGTQKEVEIARFRVFVVKSGSMLRGVTPEEAEANCVLVEKALAAYAEVETFLKNLVEDKDVNGATAVAAKQLLEKHYETQTQG